MALTKDQGEELCRVGGIPRDRRDRFIQLVEQVIADYLHQRERKSALAVEAELAQITRRVARALHLLDRRTWRPGEFHRILGGISISLRIECGRSSVGVRLNVEDLRDYIAVLRDRLAPVTVVTQLRHLSAAIAVMDPSADRSLLKLALSRLTPRARPVRNKSDRLESPHVLLGLGQKLMAEWRSRPAHYPRLNAMDYRDGLLIALLALCPLRLQNLAAIRIGRHLIFESGRARLTFTADEMKGNRPLEVEVPAPLQAPLSFYLSDVHPQLYRGPQLGAALWPSLHTAKGAMSEHGIYTRITQVTAKHLGRSVSPHMFRDAAATFLTELAPQHAMIAAAVLQHTDADVTMRHYVHGQQHNAVLEYHVAIDEVMARAVDEAIAH